MDVYRNPIAMGGDFADPFVLRHDGRYYLYATNPDARCWSSDDLLHWDAEGPTIDDDEFPGLVPFAPEVVYADGVFYMYTSPSGHGHFVLSSDSPTGPFRKISDNIGHAIDGNVLVDDDGRWYFYWAGDEGIWGCEMPSPTEFGPPVFTGVHMNGWTEGPFVSKRDGRYHMTLTGNHYLSRGYRIDAAWSLDPLRDYREDPLNPVLVQADGPTVGLGHSSSVRGPDLVSTYLVYHNLNADESRDLDLDRQVWNGHSLQVLGPTTSAPVPAPADLSSNWANGSDDWAVVTGHLEVRDGSARLGAGDDGSDDREARAVWRRAIVGRAVTAELNLTPSPTTSVYGVSIGAPATHPSLTLLVHRAEHSVRAVIASGGGETVTVEDELPRAFAHDALHCWRLVASDDQLQLLLDGRLQLTVPFVAPRDAVIGVLTTGGGIRIGHCALTADVAAAADRAAVKPVPGRFWAALTSDHLPSDGTPESHREPQVASLVLEPGVPYTYGLHVQRPGRSTVFVSGDFAAGDALQIGVDDGHPIRVRVTEPARVVSADVMLDRAAHTLSLEAVAGRPEAALITVAAALPPRTARLATTTLTGWGKRELDAGVWHDVVFSGTVHLRLDAPDAHGDVLVRATHLADGGAGDDARLGIDFLLGYSIQLHRDRVVLARHDYDERVLATRAMTVDQSLPHRLVVRATGGRLDVRLDGAEVLRVDDPLPHLFGRVALRVLDADLRVDDVHIGPDTDDGPTHHGDA